MLTFTILATLFSGQAYAKKAKSTPQPCWVAHPCAPFLSETHLIGVGSGLDIASANSAALGSLSQQLTVTIQQQQIATKENSNTVRDQQQLSETDYQNLRTKTQVTATANLDRVEYVEHWTQYRKGAEPLVYTLAVINRQDWIDQLSTERREIQSNISKAQFELKKLDHIFDQMTQYRAMATLVDQDQLLFAQQQLIEANPTVMPPSYTRQQIINSVETARRQHPFSLTNDNHPAINQSLQQHMQQSGFSVDSTSATTLQCTGTPEVSEPDNYGFYHYTLRTQCEISHNGVSVWSETFNAQTASRDAAKAERQLWIAMDTELKALPQQLLELFAL